MSAVRWSLSPLDFRAHAILEGNPQLGVLVGHCGHQLPAAAGIDPEPRGAACRACALMVAPRGGPASHQIRIRSAEVGPEAKVSSQQRFGTTVACTCGWNFGLVTTQAPSHGGTRVAIETWQRHVRDAGIHRGPP